MKFKKPPKVDNAGRQRPVVNGPKAPVYSYHSRPSPNTESDRQDVNQPRNAATKPARRPLSFWLVAAAILFLAVAGLIVLQPTPTVTVLASDAPALHSNDDYAQALAEQITGNPLYRIKPLINKPALIAGLQSRYPEVQQASVETPLLGSIKLSVTVAPALLVLSSSNGAFVVTEQGRAAERIEATDKALVAGLPLVQDDSGIVINRGQQVLTRSATQFIATVQAHMVSQDIVVERYSLPNNSGELQAKIAGRPYYARFNTQADARQQVGALLAISEKLATDGVGVKEYIDLRVDERVYYR